MPADLASGLGCDRFQQWRNISGGLFGLGPLILVNGVAALSCWNDLHGTVPAAIDRDHSLAMELFNSRLVHVGYLMAVKPVMLQDGGTRP